MEQYFQQRIELIENLQGLLSSPLGVFCASGILVVVVGVNCIILAFRERRQQ